MESGGQAVNTAGHCADVEVSAEEDALADLTPLEESDYIEGVIRRCRDAHTETQQLWRRLWESMDNERRLAEELCKAKLRGTR